MVHPNLPVGRSADYISLVAWEPFTASPQQLSAIYRKNGSRCWRVRFDCWLLLLTPFILGDVLQDHTNNWCSFKLSVSLILLTLLFPASREKLLIPGPVSCFFTDGCWEETPGTLWISLHCSDSINYSSKGNSHLLTFDLILFVLWMARNTILSLQTRILPCWE